ncbi:hypothetical protein DIPPA_28998 [Diplonema papillatum]|nr:hypothetical protein DIPPA_28998 [Diplonema papillatum]
MAERKHLLAHLSKDAEVESDEGRRVASASGGSNPLLSPEKTVMKAADIVVPDAVWKYNTAVSRSNSEAEAPSSKEILESRNAERAALLTQVLPEVLDAAKSPEPKSKTGSTTPTRKPSRDVESPPPGAQATTPAQRYLLIQNIPQAVTTVEGGSCIAHSSLLRRRALGRVGNWDDLDLQRGILVVTQDHSVALGLIDRRMLREPAKYRGMPVVAIDTGILLDDRVMHTIDTTNAGSDHCIDFAWANVMYEVASTESMPDDHYLHSVVCKEELAARKELLRKTPTPAPEPKRRKRKKASVAIVDVIDTDSEDGDGSAPFRSAVRLEKRKKDTLHSTLVPAPSASRMPPPAAKRARPEVIVIDDDGVDDDAEDGAATVATDRSGSRWKTRTERATRPSNSNKFFRPQDELRKQFPCKSLFHDKFSGNTNRHASPECPYCATCHWMEVLFNGEDPACPWKHEPTETKIKRSVLDKADKQIALKLFKAWQTEGETATNSAATGAATGAPVPAGPTPLKEVKKEVETASFTPPVAKRKPRNIEEPDEAWQWD